MRSSTGTRPTTPRSCGIDYLHSLCAAFTVDEVRGQLTGAGLDALGVEAVSDRHLLVAGRVP